MMVEASTQDQQLVLWQGEYKKIETLLLWQRDSLIHVQKCHNLV